MKHLRRVSVARADNTVTPPVLNNFLNWFHSIFDPGNAKMD